MFLHDVWLWFVFSSTGRESSNRCHTVCESTVLLLDTMQCNLSVHKICVWTEFGVVIKLLYSLYYTNDLSDPDATGLTWPLNKRGGCDRYMKYDFTRFYNWFTTVSNEITNSSLSRFCLLSEEFILKQVSPWVSVSMTHYNSHLY
jgi:hypothetical protein